MRSKLITVDRLKEILGATEPATALPVNTVDDGPPVEFKVNPGWADGYDKRSALAPVDAKAKVGGREVRLSGDALLTAASAVGMPMASFCAISSGDKAFNLERNSSAWPLSSMTPVG